MRVRFVFEGDYETYENGCNHLVGTTCPIDAGEDVLWHFTMPVTAEYPLIDLLVEVSLLDENQEPVFCAAIEAKVLYK